MSHPFTTTKSYCSGIQYCTLEYLQESTSKDTTQLPQLTVAGVALLMSHPLTTMKSYCSGIQYCTLEYLQESTSKDTTPLPQLTVATE